MISELNPIKWKKNLKLLDQRILPHQEEWVVVESLEDAYNAIRDMVVRGAPCIGFTAIFGMALWAKAQDKIEEQKLREAGKYLIEARPTAVNLKYEVNRCIQLFLDRKLEKSDEYFYELECFGKKCLEQSFIQNRTMAKFAQKELESKYGERPLKLMTHCNTGFLACGALGTALGVISHLAGQERIENVWVDETQALYARFEINSLRIS